jgi:hypothetical protein
MTTTTGTSDATGGVPDQRAGDDADEIDGATEADDKAELDGHQAAQQPGEDPAGPLDPAAVRRVVTADVLTVATADRDGTRDVTVLAGRRCFVRVLDAAHLAWPDEGLEPTGACRANLTEDPRVALLLLGSGGDGRRRGRHLNGTARVVPADELRTEHPDLPVEPVPGRCADVWVVVEVGDAYPLDDGDAPPVGPVGARPPAPAPEPAHRRHLLPALIALVAVRALVTALAAVTLAGSGTEESAAAPPPAPVADPGPTGPPTLYGQVREVRDPATVVVDVAGRPVTVGVVGLDAAAVPACAAARALDFARTTLQGRTVTLVPDPTLPAPPPGAPSRAYVVLDTQLSYTDAAILAGWSPAAGPAQYRAVFDREQADAQADRVGMWGPPCTRRG